MNIGEAGTRAGLPAKTIRYYEEIGLIRPARRANGYRDYSPADVQGLALLGRARALGFSIEDCRALLALERDRGRASADVRRIAEGHLAGIADRIAALRAMEAELSRLVSACHGDAGPDCAILDGLAGGERREA